MKIATWNINSVRIRLHNLKKINEMGVDIICLQETKVDNDNFPISDIKSLGFENIYFDGEKSYNGVAILSRHKLTNITKTKFVNDDKRHISAIIPGDIELHNFYVPAGGDIPDAKENPKFDHKLKFVDEMKNWFSKNRKKTDKMILVGDLNIAPLENDVWSHKQLLTVVSHTPIEVEKLTALKTSMNWVDSARKFTPDSEKLYSWWSYRNKDWKKSNRGRRLDHAWVSAPLEKNIKSSTTFKEARDWEKNSDHVPIITEIKI